MWRVKNEGSGPIVLNNPDIKIEAKSVMDLDKVADRATLERSRSLTVALNKGYLVELEKTENRIKETVVIKDEKPKTVVKDMSNDFNNMKSEIIHKLAELIDNKKTDNGSGITKEDLENFKSSVVGEVKELIKSNPVAIKHSEDSSDKVPSPKGVKVVDKDELELRKGFVADVAKEFETEKGDFGKSSKDKSDISELAGELEDLLK